ncbi:uridine kinase family protein [Actinoplanes xinjiangensis]|uniref:uridine kinase family protein n=1 Tax=Actinoplanes xinjiangensis TaxID=512350 RepID=UPI003430C2B1
MTTRSLAASRSAATPPAEPGFLLTLTGGAGAGKTTLAAALAASRDAVATLHLDDYYFTDAKHGVWRPDENGIRRLDVGEPESIDFTRLNADVTSALTASTLVITEGLFAARTEPLVPSARFDVFVDLPADLRLARKIHRKCVRDGFPIEVLLANYLSHRREAHDRHIEPARHCCDLVVDAQSPADYLAAQIWHTINRQLVHNS